MWRMIRGVPMDSTQRPWRRLRAALPWLLLGLGVGLLASWQSRSTRDLAARQAPYAAAHHLMLRIHTLATSGDLGLNSVSLAGELDLIVLFATDEKALARALTLAAKHMTPAAGLWIAWAKKSSPLATELDFDAVQQPTATTTGLREYGVSKLANVLFATELARRVPEDEVLVRSLHPGVIASDVWRRVPWPVRPVMKLFMRSVEQGAETTLHCATADDVGGVNGCYMSKRRPKDPSKVVTPELAAELWRRSEDWVEHHRR